MPLYRFRAMDQAGKASSGCLDAANESAVAAALRAKSLYVLAIQLASKKRHPGGRLAEWRQWIPGLGGIGASERVFFFRQMSVMLRSGLPLIQSLDVCSREEKNPKMAGSIRQIIRDIQQGQSLSACLGQHPKLFSAAGVKLIASGEASGELDRVLERLAEYLEASAAIRSKLITSLAYPGIVVLAASGVGLFLTAAVIPKFAAYFSKRHMSLPASTELLMEMSALVQVSGPWLFLGVWGLLIGGALCWRRPEGRLRLSRVVVRIPLIGKVLELAAMAQLGKTLAMLMGSGLTVTESLHVASKTVHHAVYQNGLHRAIESVLGGHSLSESLGRAEFPFLLKRMISVGEQTGELPQALDQMGAFYESELQSRIARMSALVEPIILVFIGGMVGFVYFAFFQAIFQLALTGK